jgi:putative transposase
MLSVIADDAAQAELRLDLDELFREGARRMLAAALEAEVDAYIAAYAAVVDERGHRLVRRNGHAPARQVAAGVGQVEVVRPRVDDRRVDPATGQRQQFQSMILPRWVRRSPKVAAVLPLLYLHGLSSSDFVPALTELLGSAAGLSASVITRLTPSGRPNTRPSGSATCKGGTMCTAGPTGCTSASAWAIRAGCAAW